MAKALDKRFFIRSSYSHDFVLDVEGNNQAAEAKLILWNQKKDSEAKNQLFYVDHQRGRICSALNDFCVDIQLKMRKNLVLNPFLASSKTQQWDVRAGYIRNVTSKDFLGVPEMATKGMDVVFSMYANEKQEWNLENSDPCYFSLHNLHNGKLLDVCQKKTEPGTPVIVWAADFFYRSKENQIWFENVDGFLCTKLNNFVVDITDGSNKAVINPPDSDNPWQKWTFSDGFIVNSETSNYVLALDANDTDVILCKKDPSSARQKWSLKYT